MLTPYQFASNRPIDGVDLDGLEYATFTIFVNNGKVMDIEVAKDYELKNKGTKGPGVRYDYKEVNKDGVVVGTQKSVFTKNMYGIYQGSDNPRLPTKGGDVNQTDWDYSLEPIDRQDAAAKMHDLKYDDLFPKQEGFKGVMSVSTTSANLDAAKAGLVTIYNGAVGNKDQISGKPVTSDAVVAGAKMYGGFVAAEIVKAPATITSKIVSQGSKALKSFSSFIKDVKDKTNAGISSVTNMVNSSAPR